jgi:methionyl-tRNA formyltransferase
MIAYFDDYSTLLEKSLQQGVSLLEDLFAIDIKNWPSQDLLSNPTLFPPRKEIDGIVDWSSDASQIVRVCNALGWRDWVKFPFEPMQIIIQKSRVVRNNSLSTPLTVIANYPMTIIRCRIDSLELIDALLPRDLILGEIVTKN